MSSTKRRKKKSNKKEIVSRLFEKCLERSDFEFDNDLVREVVEELGSRTNPYDMTKLDDTSKLPEMLLKKDYSLVHSGGGKHRFIKGVDRVFHRFEKINRNEEIEWPYRPSILNDFSGSENSVLSLCFNHRIIHDFLYHDIAANPKIYGSERKNKISFDYEIGKENLEFNNLQIEIDLTTENNGQVTVYEGKNAKKGQWNRDFNVFQIYNPFRYYADLNKAEKLNITELNACYLLRQKKKDGSIIRLYLYSFENAKDASSIKLLKKREYRLKRRGIHD